MRESRDRRVRVQTSQRELLEALRREKVDPAELKQKLSAFEALRSERRREQRARLHSRYGTAVTRPEVKSELEHHARRLARLQRMEVVAATEREGKAKQTLLDRIQNLRTLEETRHRKVMQELVPNVGDLKLHGGVPLKPRGVAAPSGAPTPGASR
jgi:hypothetical protein